MMIRLKLDILLGPPFLVQALHGVWRVSTVTRCQTQIVVTKVVVQPIYINTYLEYNTTF